MGSDEIRTLRSIPVTGNPHLSEAIVNYVARTKQSVILNDAVREGDFTHDPYIVQNQPKSLLCTPLIHQGLLIGLLYLENNLTTGAFTADRLTVLNLLSAQAAISIENAFLYHNLDELVDQRTQELSQALGVIEQAKEAAEKELQEARQMQLSLMPASAPHIEGFDIAGVCVPATAVGGDSFTYLWLDEGKTQLGIVLMDVTGHGMRAATTTFLANGMLQSEYRNTRSPGEILTKMNQSLKGVLPKRSFVAAAFAQIDLHEKTLTHFNAALPEPILLRGGVPVELHIQSAAPLGCPLRAEYVGTAVALRKGDVLLLFSDGLTEARKTLREGNGSGEGEAPAEPLPSPAAPGSAGASPSHLNGYARNGDEQEYGQDRLGEMLSSLTLQPQPAQAWVDAILADVRAFRGSDELEDDVTLVVVRVL